MQSKNRYILGVLLKSKQENTNNNLMWQRLPPECGGAPHKRTTPWPSRTLTALLTDWVLKLSRSEEWEKIETEFVSSLTKRNPQQHTITLCFPQCFSTVYSFGFLWWGCFFEMGNTFYPLMHPSLKHRGEDWDFNGPSMIAPRAPPDSSWSFQRRQGADEIDGPTLLMFTPATLQFGLQWRA